MLDEELRALADVRAEQARRLSAHREKHRVDDRRTTTDVESVEDNRTSPGCDVDAGSAGESGAGVRSACDNSDRGYVQSPVECNAGGDTADSVVCEDNVSVPGYTVGQVVAGGHVVDTKDLTDMEAVDVFGQGEHCAHCGRTGVVRSRSNKHMCVECERAWHNRMHALRDTNRDWMTIAKQAGLELWERQPGETQWEYEIWQCYRDQYPQQKPSLADVARTLALPRNVVNTVATRWQYVTRLQSWVRSVDIKLVNDRRQAIADMHTAHLDLARKMSEKASEALKYLDASTMSAKDITSMLRTMVDIENKARLDQLQNDEKLAEVNSAAENPNLKTVESKQSDLGEIVGVLAAAGVLGDITRIGVKSGHGNTEVVAEVNRQQSEADEIYSDANYIE